MGFFSKSKTGLSDLLQTLSLAFLVDFSDIMQLKKTKVGLSDSQEMCISLLGKWQYNVLCANKNEEQPGGFGKKDFKN